MTSSDPLLFSPAGSNKELCPGVPQATPSRARVPDHVFQVHPQLPPSLRAAVPVRARRVVSSQDRGACRVTLAGLVHIFFAGFRSLSFG